jgi:hypothetical protein
MKYILCLVMVLFFSIGGYAQPEEKVLTQAEFDAIYQNSREAWSLDNWKGKAFRRTIVTGSSVEGRPQTDFSSKNVSEYASPTSYRNVYETTFGEKKSVLESVRTGAKIYVRKAGEDWKESKSEVPAPAAKPVMEAAPVIEKIEYKFLGTEKLNNRTVRLYVKTVKSKRTDPTSGEESLADSTTKFWITEDGVLLKTDMLAVSRAGEKTHRTVVTEILEQDESIKIVAPTAVGAR